VRLLEGAAAGDARPSWGAKHVIARPVAEAIEVLVLAIALPFAALGLVVTTV